jgi:hypothetical protein
MVFNIPSVAIPPDKVEEFRTILSDIEHYEVDDDKCGIIETLENAKKGEKVENETDPEDIISLCTDNNHKNTKISFTSYEALELDHPNDKNNFRTLVYGIKHDQMWTKIYKCRADLKTILGSEFIFEVYYQNKARDLNDKCKFKSPKIIDYGHFVRNGLYYCYMHMDFVNGDPLNYDYEACVSIADNIKSVDECMISNGLHHNDLLPRNAFKDTETGLPIIIDYGLALSKKRGNIRDWSCTKPASVPRVTSHGGESTSRRKTTKHKVKKRKVKTRKHKKTKRKVKTRKHKKTKN